VLAALVQDAVFPVSEMTEDGAGRITLVLAGDGAVAVDVEALEVTLKDVTAPYVATSGKTATDGV
jgi:hypothetical protein